MEIVDVQTPEQLAAVADLFQDYRRFMIELGVPLDDFQGYSEEIAGLPGKYAREKRGALLLAYVDGAVAGCIALKDLGDGTGEVKRLWIAPAVRKRGVARSLVASILAAARAVPAETPKETPAGVLGAGASPAALRADDSAADGDGAVAVAATDAASTTAAAAASADTTPTAAPSDAGASGSAAAAAAPSPATCRGYYRRLVLDTLLRLEGAIPLYKGFGFTECEAYVFNPMPDVVYMALDRL